MAKTWVLDTETKGTGAHIAPLPGKRGKPAPADAALSVVQLARPPRPRDADEQPAAEPARRFKLVDVRAARVLGEDLELRAAMDELGRFESPIDVRAYLWQESERRWRLLTLAQTRTLWETARKARRAQTATPWSSRSCPGSSTGRRRTRASA